MAQLVLIEISGTLEYCFAIFNVCDLEQFVLANCELSGGDTYAVPSLVDMTYQ